MTTIECTQSRPSPTLEDGKQQVSGEAKVSAMFANAASATGEHSHLCCF